MNIGNLEATLGIDSSQLKTAEASLRQFGATSDSTFGAMGSAASMAHGHLTAMVGTMAALVGVTVSLGGAFALVKQGIEEITSFNIGAISTAAMMLSRANVEGIEAQQAAYGNYKAYVLEMYEVLEAETQRHFASGKEMIGGFDAFARKGIYAAQEEAGAIGVVTDAVKLLHRGYVDEGIMQHEIQGLLEGHAGIRFKLAQQLKGMLGETWKEQVQAAAQNGTLLTFLEEKFKGLGVASGDIQKNLQAQETTFYTLISQVGRGGLGGLYEDIVGLVTDINSYLREHKDSLIVGIAEGWAKIKGYIQGAVDLAKELNSATSVKMPTQPEDRTFGQQIAANFKESASPINLVSGLIDKVASDLKTAYEFITSINNTCVTWATLNIEKPFRDANTALEGVEAIINRIVAILNKPITWTIIANVIGLPPWLGGKGDFVGPPAPSPSDKVTRPDLVHQAGLRASKTGEYMTSQGLLTVPDWSTISTPKPPPDNPALDAGKSKGGKGKGAEAEINRLNSLFDTLNKDIARLSEGKLSAIEADYVKTVESIYKKTSDRAHSEAEVEILAKTRATLQKGKLQDDFDLKMAKDSGDVFLEIQKQYEKDVSDFKGLVGEKEKTEANRAKKELDARMKFQETVMGMQSTSLSAMASAAPLLSQQLPIESALLDIEIKRGNLKMEEELRILRINHMISAGQEEELRGLKALSDQDKRDAQDRKNWQLQGWVGGARIGALDLQKTAETWQADQMASWIKGAPQAISTEMASMFVNTLQGKKTDFEQLGFSMAQSMIQKMLEGILNQIIPTLANGVANIFNNSGMPTGWQGGASAGASWLTKLLGGGGPGTSGYDYQPGGYGFLNWHSGGIIRAHGGLNLASDEVPAILQTGERVLSRGQNSDYERGGSGPPQINFTVINNSSKVETKTEQNAQGDIITTIDDLVSKAYAGRGKLHKLINSGNSATRR